MSEPTQEYLRECFKYEDGKLYWKERPRHHFQLDKTWKWWNSRWSGTEAGGKPVYKKSSNSYRFQIKVLGKTFSRSRLIFILINGQIKNGMEIDHVNGISTDDRIENLREVSRLVNSYNRKLQGNNSSGYNGVCFYKDGRKKPWQCSYYENGSRVSKFFETRHEAVSFREQCDRINPDVTSRHGKRSV